MKYGKLIDAVKKAKTIAIFCHKNPDGDTLGSGLALFCALKKTGKAVDIFCDDNLPKNFSDLALAGEMNATENKNHDLGIAVDCGDEGRLGGLFHNFFECETTAQIDHHKSNTKYAEINYIEVNVSACAEIMFAFLTELKNSEGLDEVEASLLYTGLLTDSGGFTFSSVTKNTLLIASKLVEFGANSGGLAYKYLKRTRRNVFDLRLRVLNRAVFHNNSQIAALNFTKEDFEATNTTPQDTEGVINTVLNVESVKIAITIAYFKEGQFKVSLRSKGNIDVSRMAQIFGGGGHKNAAGCQFFGYYEEVLEKLLKAADDAVYEF